jgi:hypothetical protein
MGNGSGQLTINQKIVIWTEGMLGKKVGRGVCWDLGEQALKQAGAQTSNDLGPVGEDIDYIWGDEIENVKDIARGDILQIRDHLVTTTTVTEYRFADGSTETKTQERTAKRGHHTAIARSMPDVNGTLKTYEQHVNGRDLVQKMTLYTRNVGPQTTHSIDRREHPKTKKNEQVKITTTVTIEVTGTIWAYRPKPKT